MRAKKTGSPSWSLATALRFESMKFLRIFGSSAVIHLAVYVEHGGMGSEYTTVCGRTFSTHDSETSYDRSTCPGCRAKAKALCTGLLLRKPGTSLAKQLEHVAAHVLSSRAARDWRETRRAMREEGE